MTLGSPVRSGRQGAARKPVKAAATEDIASSGHMRTEGLCILVAA